MKIRVFTTFNYIFSQYIGFMVPLIIVGLVTPAICKMGAGAGKLLLTLLQGTPFSFGVILQFVMMLSVLGFNGESQALMITLYIVMDSFGTACNVMSDGAISLVIDFKKKATEPLV